MKTTLITITILIIVGVIINQVLFGKVHKIIYEGQFKNKKVIIYGVLNKNLVQYFTTYTIKLGDLPTIQIDGLNTDLRGCPYDDALYKDAKRVYFDTTIHYKNDINYDDNLTRGSMLYLNSKKFSATDFDEYADFFKTEWYKINQQLPIKQLGGIVFGNIGDFKQVFKGVENGEIFCVEVLADGTVLFKEEKGALGFTSLGLSPKVTMPNRILYNIGNKPMDYYRKFKDENGKSLEDFFTILEKENK
jgi:hypothetical protein